jgi:hypothetical protein
MQPKKSWSGLQKSHDKPKDGVPSFTLTKNILQSAYYQIVTSNINVEDFKS